MSLIALCRVFTVVVPLLQLCLPPAEFSSVRRTSVHSGITHPSNFRAENFEKGYSLSSVEQRSVNSGKKLSSTYVEWVNVNSVTLCRLSSDERECE